MNKTLTSIPPSYSRRVHFLKQQAALTFSILIATTVWSTGALAQADPLASWNDTAAKKAIIAFVEKVTEEGSPDFVRFNSFRKSLRSGLLKRSIRVSNGLIRNAFINRCWS